MARHQPIAKPRGRPFWLQRLTLSLVITMSLGSESFAKPKTEKDWIACRDKAEASVSQFEVGIAGVEAAILDRCGKRPLVKSKAGHALLASDCDWLYNQPVAECLGLEQAQCGEGVQALSMASQRGFHVFSAKVFKLKHFDTMCKQLCRTRTPIDRQAFSKQFCSGS